MGQLFLRDMQRIIETKARVPDNNFIFSNIKDWMLQKFEFPLFETLAAFPNPQNYYQPIFVDGEKLRCDWQGSWLRSIGFLPNGNILIYTKSVVSERFNPEAQWFQFFFLMEFTPQELEIEFEPPKMLLRANDLKKEGINLLNGEPASHVFNFTLANMATDRSTARGDALEKSAFYKEILRRGRTQEQMAQDKMAKSDAEKFMVTTLHYAPHPLIMRLYKEFGYETRFSLQTSLPPLLQEHFKKLVDAKKA